MTPGNTILKSIPRRAGEAFIVVALVVIIFFSPLSVVRVRAVQAPTPKSPALFTCSYR